MSMCKKNGFGLRLIRQIVVGCGLQAQVMVTDKFGLIKKINTPIEFLINYWLVIYLKVQSLTIYVGIRLVLILNTLNPLPTQLTFSVRQHSKHTVSMVTHSRGKTLYFLKTVGIGVVGVATKIGQIKDIDNGVKITQIYPEQPLSS